MKRSPPSLHFLAAADAATTAVMSIRPRYRGGQNQWRRGFSDRPYSSDNDHFVSGDSHFRSVRETNQGFRPVEPGNFTNHTPYRPNPRAPPFNPRRNFNQNQPFRPPAPPHFSQNERFRPPGPSYYNQNQQFRPQGGPHFHQNQQFQPSQWFRPRPPRAPDFRDWEYAKPRPPPNCERFTVLSYNILADYLALNHRNQLYFHIPHYILEWEFRKRNILTELGWWSADILCFQEVDRFRDLEDELKVRGYSGIWKMRTGDPVDGCAIFWRASRFKLLHEEFIEYKKLGLRDNVAQICVLESMGQNNTRCDPALPESSAGANKVVVCNIHVLFNPRRGEIKLGQVRVLLDRAYAVSKLWDNAPVVVCGDFNCTPKSPVYNFISDQKLNVTELPRDKLSGQASAEIRPPRPHNPNPGAQPGPPSSVAGKEVKQKDTQLDMQDMSSSDMNLENIPCMSSLAQPLSKKMVMNVSAISFIKTQHDDVNNLLLNELMESDQQGKEDVCKDETPLNSRFHVSGSNKSPSSSNNTTSSSHNEDIDPHIVTRSREETHATSIVSHGSFGEHSQTTLQGDNEILNSDMGMDDNCSTDAASHDKPNSALNLDTTSCEQLEAKNLSNVIEVSPLETSENMPSLSVTNDNESPLTTCEVGFADRYEREDIVVDEKMEKSLRNELGEASEDGSLGEDCATFLSELHNADVHLPSDSSQHPGSGSTDGTESVEILDDLSGNDQEPFITERTPYNPSAWTPMEIEIATGSSDCTFMEHPIKLRSTYSEIEDHSGTRDANGEPHVTSYHRRFSGTVDYIWRSEGLQTIRVRAPMQREAMQWTPGFPTKKWGSDHIALVTELAFRKDDNIQDSEVRLEV